MGAHRVEALEEGGRRVFAVRTNALAALPVRPGYASYGAETCADVATLLNA